MSPGLLLGIRNAGDSCFGVFGFEVADGRLVQVDPAGLSRSVFKVDNYFLRALQRLPGDGLLVVDRDHHLGRLAWPPTGERPMASSHIVAHLRDDDFEIQIPWFSGDASDLEPSETLTVTSDHLLFNVDANGSFTVAMVAFDPVTLAPLGLVKRPKSRLRFSELVHLGDDLFAGAGSTSIHWWRLRR